MQDRPHAQTGSAEGLQEPAVDVVHPEPHIAVLTLNRPAARNTLSEAMLAALQSALDRLAADDDTRAIVLAAKGPAFCAGHDLRELSGHRSDGDGGRAYYAKLMGRCGAMMQSIVANPKPVIAAVHASAAAAGCQLVASCDLAVASERAQFGTTGINNGLFCATPMVALSRKIARKPAMEMLLLGDLISARDALERGLVNRVVPADKVMGSAMDLARRIAAKSPAAIALGKRAFYRQVELPLAEAYALASQAMVDNLMLDDAVEGIGAFLEKRQPKWSGH